MSKLDKGTFRVKRETLSEGYFFLCSEILVFFTMFVFTARTCDCMDVSSFGIRV